MKDDLQKYITDLSIRDKKTVEQKTLKVSEECGELSDAVLAYVSAPQSMHKIATERSILEESVDVTLSALSIPLSMGFSFDDIHEMMEKKSNKWASLQSNETALRHMIEIHLYVTAEKSEVNTDLFMKVCPELGVKPIMVENVGVKTLDIMTSSRFFGDVKGAMEQSSRIEKGLAKYGFKVYRTKLETIPTHPAAINVENQANDFYMEAHLQVYIPNAGVAKDELVKFFNNNTKIHLSKNPFKSLADGYVQMLTLRDKISATRFTDTVNSIYTSLLTKGFQVIEKPEIELCIYDDNPNPKNF